MRCSHDLNDRITRKTELQVSLDKSDGLGAKNPSGLSRIRIKEGCFSRISRIRLPKIVRVIEGPTYRSPTNRGTPVLKTFQTGRIATSKHDMKDYETVIEKSM